MTDIDLSLFPETVETFDGSEQRATVFLDRYSAKDKNGKPFETLPADMWERVSLAIGEGGEQRRRFRELLEGFKFVPGGRILSGAGINSEVTFYNCYVIPVETKVRRHNNTDGAVSKYGPECTANDPGNDSREAIFDTIGLMVDIMSRGGGVGINWSVLRPKGAYLKRVNGTTSGPVSWMDVASRAVGVVEQGGTRRGAAMFMLDDWHPDVLDFINAKRDFSLITNANVSVAVSDEFMAAVKSDSMWSLVFPDTTHPAYNAVWNGDLDAWTLGGYPLVKYAEFPARDLWRKLAEAAHASGEPGVVFLDRYNKLRTASYVGEGTYAPERIISVNPCGEQGLEPYAVCNLGAMNLAAYVRPSRRGNKPSFDWSAFSADVATAVEFLDAVIDKNYYFIPENEDIQKRVRRIGLGVMGLADALIALKLRYGSEGAADFTGRVFRTMKQAAVSRSSFLAQQKGAAPDWQKSMLDSPYLREFKDTQLGVQIARYGLRNLFLLTQAPTGTTSILAGVNSGIEPFFAFEYTRKDRTGEHKVAIPALQQYRREGGLETGYVPLPDYFVTSGDVTVEEHIAMQAAAQHYVDSSISKTINAPNDHTVEDVERAYTLAYESGLKGLAYFRDGSGRAQVLYKDEPAAEPKKFVHIDWCDSQGSFGDKDCSCPETEREEILLAKYDELQTQLAELAPHAVVYKRPDALFGTTVKVRTSAGTAYVTVNVDETGKPVELFINVGKAGSDIMELGEAIGRVATLGLQSGATLASVAQQLVGIGGNGKFNPPLAHAIGVALLEVNLDNAERRGGGYHDCADLLRSQGVEVPYGIEVEDPEDDQPDIPHYNGPVAAPAETVERWHQTGLIKSPTGQACPDCHNFSVVIQEGCSKCALCGWSAC